MGFIKQLQCSWTSATTTLFFFFFHRKHTQARRRLCWTCARRMPTLLREKKKKKKKSAYTHTSELIQQSCHSRSPSSLWKKLIAWRHNSTQYAMHALLTGISNSSTWRHSPPAPLPYTPLLPTDQKHDQAWKSHPHHQRASKKIATAHLHIKLLTTC